MIIRGVSYPTLVKSTGVVYGSPMQFGDSPKTAGSRLAAGQCGQESDSANPDVSAPPSVNEWVQDPAATAAVAAERFSEIENEFRTELIGHVIRAGGQSSALRLLNRLLRDAAEYAEHFVRIEQDLRRSLAADEDALNGHSAGSESGDGPSIDNVFRFLAESLIVEFTKILTAATELAEEPRLEAQPGIQFVAKAARTVAKHIVDSTTSVFPNGGKPSPDPRIPPLLSICLISPHAPPAAPPTESSVEPAAA